MKIFTKREDLIMSDEKLLVPLSWKEKLLVSIIMLLGVIANIATGFFICKMVS